MQQFGILGLCEISGKQWPRWLLETALDVGLVILYCKRISNQNLVKFNLCSFYCHIVTHQRLRVPESIDFAPLSWIRTWFLITIALIYCWYNKSYNIGFKPVPRTGRKQSNKGLENGTIKHSKFDGLFPHKNDSVFLCFVGIIYFMILLFQWLPLRHPYFISLS